MPINSFDKYPMTWKPDMETLTPPYYKALAEDLERRIKSGQLQAGTKLPPQRELADYLDLNYTTITRVYELCRKKGLIYGTVGKGTFVSPHSAEDITIAAPTGGEFIELGGINGFSEHSEYVEQATRAVIEKGYLRSLYEYSQPAGYPHQLAAGVRWMEQLGMHADIEHCAIFSGAQNALTVALLSLFAPGDKIATDEYTYSNFIELAKMLHLVLVPIRGDECGMLAEELDRQCRRSRIKGVYLIPTYANPTTVSIPLARRRELAELIRAHKLILIEDDIASWLCAAGENAVPSMFDIINRQSIYICGMTKSLCPGLRIAYMAFGEGFKARILHGLANANIKTSALDAEIITELILNGNAYKIAGQKRILAQRSNRLYAEFFPEYYDESCPAGYYRWLPIRTGKGFRELEAELMQRGVRVYHGERFSVAGTRGEEFLRVALCSAGSPRRLEQGLAILRDYLQEASL